MKKPLSQVVFVLALTFGSAILAAYHSQNKKIKRGDLIILNPTEGVFPGGPMFVDKTSKTITSKASVFPTTLWENKDGDVLSRRDMVAYRAYVIANVPASNSELALYRRYFPSRSQVVK
ncbi:MAG: hypothetical protein AAB468_03110 [Patescibacteria group bacterium]